MNIIVAPRIKKQYFELNSNATNKIEVLRI